MLPTIPPVIAPRLVERRHDDAERAQCPDSALFAATSSWLGAFLSAGLTRETAAEMSAMSAIGVRSPRHRANCSVLLSPATSVLSLSLS